MLGEKWAGKERILVYEDEEARELGMIYKKQGLGKSEQTKHFNFVVVV